MLGRKRKSKKKVKEWKPDNVLDYTENDRTKHKWKGGGAKAKRKKNRKSFSLKRVIAFIVCIILALIILFSLNNIVTLKQKEKKANQELSDLKIQRAELRQKVKELDSREYIEHHARTWLKMAREGDRIYIMNGDPLHQDTGVTQDQEKNSAERNQSKTDNDL